ncbi:MAG: HAD hydrolase family protein [Nanoarchaeota archaeon]|nr:HAD hydrolase family protein [Nanoarchaeota archaeon]MBU1004802.1 HAD hydrolase family protein [Nanoarchaeota archaeon]MBU1946480.1 HAD hydrolase family protein [Nanoarchaeota archaeon]
MNKDYVIGIDLHGTLLDRDWEIKQNLIGELKDSIERVKANSEVLTCTGNDLTFVKKHVPKEIFDLFDGFVLETGCVISDGKEEKVISKPNEIKIIKELEEELKKQKFKELAYFARRLSTISLFTKDPYDSNVPRDFHPIVDSKIKELGFENDVFATYSSVAVDIIPKGYNKATGINYIAGGRKTIGVADSLNDSHLLTDCNQAFIPINSPVELLDYLRVKGKKIENIKDINQLFSGKVIQSKKGFTGGVIEILNFIDKMSG